MCPLIARANAGSVIFCGVTVVATVVIMMGTGSVPTAVGSALTAEAAMMFSGAVLNFSQPMSFIRRTRNTCCSARQDGWG